MDAGNLLSAALIDVAGFTVADYQVGGELNDYNLSVVYLLLILIENDSGRANKQIVREPSGVERN